MESIGEYEERKESEIQNLCITCKKDMGPDNPRQLCGKYQCDYIEYMSEDEIKDQNIDDKDLLETKDHLEDDVFDLHQKYYKSRQHIYDEMYYELKLAFTPDFYEDAKIQFSDVCSNGDVYINDMLDELNLICNKNIVPDTSMKIEHYIESIYNFYKEVYSQGGEPNPWWAD